MDLKNLLFGHVKSWNLKVFFEKPSWIKLFFVPTVFSHNRDFTGVYLYVNSRKGHKKAGELTGHKRLDLKVFHCDCHSFSSHNIDCKQNEKKNMINFYQKQDNVKQAWSLRPRFSIALASKTNSFWNEKKTQIFLRREVLLIDHRNNFFNRLAI